MWLKTLKSKIILYFLLISLIPATVLTLFYYLNTKDIYEDNMLENSFSTLYYIKKQIDDKIYTAKSLSDWFYLNPYFKDIFHEDNSRESLVYDKNMIDIYNDQIKQQVINSPLFTDISSLVIVGNNGIELKYGYDASMIKVDEIKSSEWFRDAMKTMSRGKKIYTPGLIKNPAQITTDEYILPIIRPVMHNRNYKEIGWVFLGFKESLLADIYQEEQNDDLTYSFFLLDQNKSGIPFQATKGLLNNSEIARKLETIFTREEGYFNLNLNGEEVLMVYEKLDSMDWYLVEKVSLKALNRQKQVLKKIAFAIFLSSLFFTSILTIYLSSNLTKPLYKIINQVNKISSGHFKKDTAIEGDNEMGLLGRKINEMALNIKGLLNKLVEEEKEKRELELKALQNQVNPHFLYNTLNSIKWMATVQKAEGIKNMVVALGRLLKNLAADTIEKITLRKELTLLKDYIYIQQIRYKGKIKFNLELEDEKLLDYKIIKFTIQPLVENAIFHGIEPKKNPGKIDLFISKDKEDLIIKVRDDGIGMSEEQIKELFSEEREKKDRKRGLSGIGLRNVNKRLKLIYGEEYGIKVKSSKGEYTEIIIQMPCEY